MRIQWTNQVDADPELRERWRAAVAKTHAFSKVAGIEFARRQERLHVLLDVIEREYAIREANDKGAGALQRRLYWWYGGGLVFGCLLWVLDASGIWNIDDAAAWAASGVIFLNIVLALYANAACENEKAAAAGKIAAAVFEFEEVSSARFPYYDLELLDEDVDPFDEAKAASFDKRRAELAVTVMDSLVERVEMLDTRP